MFNLLLFARSCRFFNLFLVLLMTLLSAYAVQKTIVLDEIPEHRIRMTVAPDGSKIIIAGSAYYLFNETGTLIDKVRTEQGSAPRDLMPVPDDFDPLIKYYSCTSYAGGHLAPCRADGSEIKTIVNKGGAVHQFHADSTGWTNPLGAALDYKNRLIFAIESSAPAENEPNPAWSRIAVFDLDGKYLRSINFFNFKAADGTPERDDARRVWYHDVAVDPNLKRVYAISRTHRLLLAFDYEGKALGTSNEIPVGDYSGLAVLPDGRIAAGSGSKLVILDPQTLKRIADVALPEEITRHQYGILDVEADEQGRLYAMVNDPSVNFVRWSADLKQAEVFGPRYLRMIVDVPALAFVSGTPFTINASITGRPQPLPPWHWQVMVRPSDGSDLRWQQLPVAVDGTTVTVTPPPTLRGVYEFAVRYGAGPIAIATRQNDPSLQWQAIFVPPTVTRSLSLFTTTSRLAFQQGEAIALQLERREADGGAQTITVPCTLERDGVPLSSTTVTVASNSSLSIPASITKRLLPGRYYLKPVLEGYECYPLPIDIASSVVDSPLQRVLYHEFGNTAINGAGGADNAERLAMVRDTVAAVARLGFTRETDRMWPASQGQNWRRDLPYANQPNAAFPPGEYFSHSLWSSIQDFYMDQAVRHGIVYDTQILSHCAAVHVRDERIADLLPKIYNTAQWGVRYPSFYGFNYNDEMFFWTNYDGRWNQDDTDYLNNIIKEQFNGVKPDAYKWALTKMYDSFNNVVTRVDPTLARTTTPMWQFPAVEGSYAPTIYQHMTESYSHFLSEGYTLPFVPAHSAEMLRRPNLPLIGIADNGYSTDGADLYQKTIMQLLVRGMQGVGISHTTAFQDPAGAQAFRTTNALAKMYGSIFAEATRTDEAAVLYSYTQDITESRAGKGTPHWERVYGLFGAGLMAGVPTRILYEEDVAAGWLIEGKTPRVPMLFLVGQKTELPAPVMRAIDAFRAAGGKVFLDSISTDIAGASRLELDTYIQTNAGYASDTALPLMQPVFEAIARALRPAVAPLLRYPVATDDVWVAKGVFTGGNARYIMLATETSPFPWDAGSVWGMGAMYCKGSHTWLPKTVMLTLPAGGVIYDVFEQSPVQPQLAGREATVSVDLTTMPGRLYAVLPAPPGVPRLSTDLIGNTLHYKVELLDAAGKPLPIQAPLRLRLVSGKTIGQEYYRGSNPAGVFEGTFDRPLSGAWSVQATELISGKSSISAFPPLAAAATTVPLVERGDVDIQRIPQIERLLVEATTHGRLYYNHDPAVVLEPELQAALTAALRGLGIALVATPFPANDAQPGIYLTIGVTETDAMLGDFIRSAWQRNLLDYPRSPAVPGAGRGYITSALAVRKLGEDAIMLIAGDRQSIEKTVVAFMNWIERAKPVMPPPLAPKYTVTGKADESASVPVLHQMVGVKLDNVRLAADGKHLVIAALDYMTNIALIADDNDKGTLVTTARVGQAPTTGSLFVSRDGTRFGASARTTERFGQGFYLNDAGAGTQHVFAGYGDIGRNINRFAASSDGNTILTSGTYGVACWQKNGEAWKETWSHDYWKEFQRLDWPISDVAERIPQFHAFIPDGADYAMIVFGEFSNNGWVTPVNTCEAKVIAVSLRDGAQRWTFDVPIMKTQIFPTLVTSPNGAQVVLKVQMGSWGKETFRFFTLDTRTGTMRAKWDAKVAPSNIAVADSNGRIAEAYSDRILAVREQDGTLLYNNYWPDHMPISLAFTADGNGLYVADDAGSLTRIDLNGTRLWSIDIGCLSTLAANANGVFAAGWDGRVRTYSADGTARWTLDCSPAMRVANPMSVLANQTVPAANLHQSSRAANSSPEVPAGVNLLRAGKATLTVGGTRGWMSGGTVQVKAEELTDGNTSEISGPWLHLNELFWNGQAGRQVWAQIDFPTPTDVSTLTVYESEARPQSWPTDALVQVWDTEQQKWQTARYGFFLHSRINTYTLNLKGVSKLRYAPWGSYYRNFFTTEIEIRGM